MLDITLFFFNLLGVLIASALLREIWVYWRFPLALPLTLYIALVLGISIMNLMYLTPVFDGVRVHYENIGFSMSFFFTITWFWGTYEYIMRQKLDWRLLLLLGIEPCVMLVAYWTNNWSVLPAGADTGGLSEFTFVRLFHISYSQLLFTLSYIWIARHVYRQTQRLGLTLLVTGTIMLPIVLFWLYIAEIIPLRSGSALSLLIFVPIVLRFHLLDIVPVARDKLADYISDGFAVLNPYGQIIDINPPAAQLLGITTAQQRALPQPIPLPPALQRGFDFANPQQQRNELTLKDTEQSLNYVDAQLSPLHNQAQNIVGHVLLLHDINLRKQAEQEREQHIQQLEHSRQKLQELDRLKSDFFANISHEFRTPLTLSLGVIQDLKEGLHGALPDDIQAPLQQAHHHNQHLLELINQIMDLSRLEAGGVQQFTEHVDLVSYIPQVLSVFAAAAARNAIHLQFQTELQQAYVCTEADALEKILNNLISNALKNTVADDRIDISLRACGDNWQLTVCDSGAGIPPQFLPHVFERFARSAHQPDQWSTSTGIGLALVKQLVLSHGGQIEAQSTLGEGSCFSFSLPQTSADKPPMIAAATFDQHTVRPYAATSTPPITDTAATAPVDVPINSDTVTADSAQAVVLLIEDHAEVRDYIHFHLADQYQLLHADDGLQGLSLAQQQIPDCIVSDVMMPKMDGYKLCQYLKNDPTTCHIPIILLTAKATVTDKLHGLSVQADDYLTKPFNRQELQARIANLLTQRLQLREYYSRLLSSTATNTDGSLDEQFLQHIRQVMTQLLSQSDLQIQTIAASLDISERQLQRKLKALTGQSPQQLLLEQRLQYASQLLTTTNLSITAISHQSGFASHSYFSRKFKSMFQQTPSNYRQTH